ncbi:hypothetical protein K7X08_000869 [Anisodus acutangulus]|uniref:Retrotransposon gag domain-containing protein n=1 Tax=Anisodus acutangulus TaxID=402998 RepID=A0A9Q1RMG5_9SOLA|nr:hypothetical protein K7X08_000869 [Anisodus acutangulus]
MEFEKLKQNGRSVHKYYLKFVSLQKYAPHMVLDMRARVRRCVYDLDPYLYDITNMIAQNKEMTITKMVAFVQGNKSRLKEEEALHKEKDREFNKRDKSSSHFSHGVGKENVVANVLSKKFIGSLAHIEEDKRNMTKEIYRLANLGVRFMDSKDGGGVVHNKSESSLVAEVKEKKFIDPYLLRLKEIHKHKTTTFKQGGDDGT